MGFGKSRTDQVCYFFLWLLLIHSNFVALFFNIIRARAATVIGLAANISAMLAILLQPYMPETCEQLQSQMNIKCNQLSSNRKFVCIMKAGHQIGKVCIKLVYACC